MQPTSDLYKELLALQREGKAWYEVNCYIQSAGGAGYAFDRYQADRIISMRTSRSLYSGSGIGVGGTAAATIDVTVRDPGTIVRQAAIQPFVRLTDGTRYSEFLLCGVFFCDTRETNRIAKTVTLHGFDPMLLMERYFYRCLPYGYEEEGVFSWDSIDAMQCIADYIGVTLDTSGLQSFPIYDPTVENPPDPDEYKPESEEETEEPVEGEEEVEYKDWYGITLQKLTTLSMRQVAGYIAAACGGNWTIRYANRGTMLDSVTLQLVPISQSSSYETVNTIGNSDGFALTTADGFLISLDSTGGADDVSNGKYHDIRLGVADFNTAHEYVQFSGITYTYSGMPDVTAGTEWGEVVRAECPFITQEVADETLDLFRGQIYMPYTAQGAMLDPAAELGDVVVIDGVESILATIDTDFDGLCAADISAPGTSEADHEFGGDMGLEFDATSESPVNKTEKKLGADIQYVADHSLKSKIVEELPEDASDQNVMWVIPNTEQQGVADELWYKGWKVSSGLKMKIVDSLPPGHKSEDVIWAIPDEGGE